MAASKKLVFAEFNWNSIQVHNRIAAFILEYGYGYEIEYTPLLKTMANFFTLARGEADINMEVWIELPGRRFRMDDLSVGRNTRLILHYHVTRIL